MFAKNRWREPLRILVTGGTGSFGKAFVSSVLDDRSVDKVCVFSRDELKQFEMHQELLARHGASALKKVRFFLGDVRDSDRLVEAAREIDVIIHAAAMKHVGAAEYNPLECIKTNIYGADNVISAAIANRVSKVIALSTDKASQPINLYGATKLASDKLFVAANNFAGGKTKFGVVRYGNVMNSRGSLLPFLRQQIAGGCKTLPLTDPRMSRFVITLEQGVAFVKQSLHQVRGGEIFVPKLPSMRILDLFSVLGFGDRYEIIGRRPGEKLHESMISADEAELTTEMSDRYIIRPGIQFHSDTGSPEPEFEGASVSDNFEYRSDSNEWFLHEADIAELLRKVDAERG